MGTINDRNGMDLTETEDIKTRWQEYTGKKKKNTQKESEVAQSCLTLCDLKDCSLPGFTVHGIFQARMLEWVAIFFSRGPSQLRDQTWVSCIARRLFTI